MKSSYENGLNPDNGPPARRHQQPVPASTEVTYELLGAYGFARRYAEGKTVADLGGYEEAGYGSHLLTQSAESVTALADLPKPPLPDGSFDVVVAFGVIEGLERPEELVEEAKRLLKEGGVLLVSVTDKRVALADGRGGMYVPEFRRLLEHHFGHVRLYRQGAVAGGLVFPASGELTAAAVSTESVRLFSGGPRLGGGPPTTCSVMAVCAEAAEALGEERAYLLLDHDRGVFAEYEERAEDVELMLGEIRRMQETEVQAYLKTMNAQQLPLGALLNLVPQIFLYYLYYGLADPEVADGRRSRVIARARHRWDTALVEARHHRDTILTQARHRWDTTLAETGHRREVALDEPRHRWEATLDEIRYSRDVALDEARRRRDVALDQARHRREVSFEEARRRREVSLEEIRHTRNVALDEARRRRDVALDEARHRRDLALADIRHRRNLILAEIRHQRNVTVEHIIHRRNIIRGNVHALRQKDAKGLAKGVLRRSSALYRWLRAGQRR